MGKSAVERITTLRSTAELKDLVKTHIEENPCLCEKTWRYKELDEVAGLYTNFLVAMAGTGKKPAKKMLRQVVKEYWEGDGAVLTAFADSLCDAISYCRKKRDNSKDGSKLSEAVKAVCGAYGHEFESQSSSGSLIPYDSTDSDDAEVIEDTPVESPEQLLAQTRMMFGAPGQRVLKPNPSTCSINSSEGASPEVTEAPAAKKARTVFSLDYNSAQITAIKTCPGNAEERVALVDGLDGFACCTWEDGSDFVSEVPNLVIASRAAAKISYKGPAKAKGRPKAKGKAKAKGKTKGKAKGKAKAKAKAIASEEPGAEDGESEASDKGGESEASDEGGESEAASVKEEVAAEDRHA